MSIAMVEQSAVDNYLERVQRFVDGVHHLRDRINEMLAARTPAGMEPEQISVEDTPSVAPISQDPIQAAPVTNPEPVAEEPVTKASSVPKPMEAVQSEPSGKSVEEINLDAIMDEIMTGMGDDLVP